MNHTIRAAFAAFADHYATSFSASDDPQRWYQPLETPRQRYDNAMLEARNALAEALHECRGLRDDRAACEAEARRQYQEEASQAKALLGPSRRGG